MYRVIRVQGISRNFLFILLFKEKGRDEVTKNSF
jgi:hypothetical protein